MSETTSTEQGSGETSEQQAADQGQPGQTFTQADVDRIVRERVARVKTQYADYDDLKTKAGSALTLEQRIAEMEKEAATTKAEALRTRVAAEFGISTKKGPKGEPSDADLFLTGADESTLTAQAQRLAGREEDRKKQGNFAPKEGATKSTGDNNGDFRDVVKQLFASAE